ncbi:DMSO/selenate family reductase complex A subunit [Raoultibacter phocaeensis]|uniref:DMSO/selenate family reductase complex A subunit n=1 Tax=Raoultibacter phocaeensis TaxID=2479841 RepID=UPI00111AAF23|nr:DMSO/selenate family reductase complex A subunit [Raoultibacter phocaeensis]
MTRMESSALSRRTFVKGSALAGLGVAAMGSTTLFGCSSNEPKSEGGAAGGDQAAPVEEKISWGHCAINCPGRCSLKFHVQDDEVVWVDTYTSKDADFDDPQPRACLRGRTYRRWMNHPDRFNTPMKRVGKRGEGKFEPISWDEAIETAATKLKEVIETYGNEAVYVPYATGVSATTSRPFNRFLNLVGGYLNFYNSYSTAQISCITPYMYGAKGAGGSSFSAAEDAALILIFGSSPTETRQGGLTTHYDWVHLRERTGAKIYVIDPRMNDSIMGHSEQWLPINPGTDAALVAAIAHELIANDMIDLEFLHTYCVGYDEETMPEGYQGQNLSYNAYVMGTGYDMVEKTPEWAAPITGISADRIRSLAEEIGTTKPLYVNQGWGPQRRSNGEWTAWSIMALPCLVGQVGLPGTNNGTREARNSPTLSSLPAGENPVETSIPCFLFTDAIDHGTEMTAKNAGVKKADALKTNIKYMINYAGNCLTNQHSDINKAHDILADESKCEFILGIDTVLCDTMKYADIILPDLFRFEQTSQIATGSDWGYMITGTACTSPKFERKSAYEMASLMAEKFGVQDQFTEGKTEEDWIKELYEQSREKDDTLPTWDEAVEMGVYTRAYDPVISMKKFRDDPVANPLETPSGKIEIFSAKVLEFTDGWELTEGDTLPGMDTLPAIPAYIPEWFGVETTTEEFPLVLNGFHYRGRIHSSWGGIEELKEVNPQEAWINPVDADARGIAQGDTIRVKNQFGEIELLAKVTPRTVPGTVAVSQGAWHDADMAGDRVDKGGSINTLTTQRPSPLSKGNPQHTNICQVSKA